MSSRKRPAITVTAEDHRLLTRLAEGGAHTMPELAAELATELDRARILPEGRVSSDHVRVGSIVSYRDETSGRDTTVTLVWPEHADIAESRVSVMTPIGVALIGMAVDKSIDWTTRSGDVKRLTVTQIRDAQKADA